MKDGKTGRWWVPVAGAVLGVCPGRMVLGAALAAITVAAGVGLLGLSGWFIVSTAIAGLHLSTALVFDIFMPSAGIRLLALGRTASRYGERLVTHDATLATLAVLRERLFLGWANGSASKVLRYPGHALFRLTGDLDALESLALRVFFPAGAALGVTLLCTVIFGFIAPWFGLLAGLWLATFGVTLTLVLSRLARVPMVQRGLAIDRLRQHAIDLVSGQVELLTSQRLAYQCRLIARADARLANVDRRLNRLELGAAAVLTFATGVTLGLALLGAAVLVEQGESSTAGAALILLMALGAMEPFAALRRGGLEAGRTWLAARCLAAPLAETQQVVLDHAPPPPPQTEAVRFMAVSARYPRSHSNVLHRISFAVQPGERVALIGPSGAGKSTLMAVVTGQLEPCEGAVTAVEHAWLGQRVDLFLDSLRDNLRLAAPDADDAALWHVLEAVGLAADIRRLHAGLSTVLGETGLGLSGGQARRLALARLLLQERPLWLLDEPTEGLDAESARMLLNRLDTLGADRSWLLVTHLQREAALADRLVVMHSGRIHAQWPRGSAGFDAALAALRPG